MLIRIEEVPVSNLGQETGYSEVPCDLPYSLHANAGTGT
jgi:hypothetical protein